MQLNKKSWHYKLWIKSFGYYDIKPISTDLCRYCHRVFWQLVKLAFIGCSACLILWAIGYAYIYKGLIHNTAPTLVISGIVVAAIGVAILYSRWMNRSRDYSEPTTLIGKYARASKDKVCPIVEFTE